LFSSDNLCFAGEELARACKPDFNHACWFFLKKGKKKTIFFVFKNDLS
jgi:hypothetical protein